VWLGQLLATFRGNVVAPSSGSFCAGLHDPENLFCFVASFITFYSEFGNVFNAQPLFRHLSVSVQLRDILNRVRRILDLMYGLDSVATEITFPFFGNRSDRSW
jgi:hypothetical protein